MTRLGLADLVLIAARVLDVPADRAARLVDLDTAAAALARARAAGERPERSAAALLAGLVRPPVARHGAARVALAAAVQLLAMDGWDLDLDPPEEVSELLLQVAGGGVLEGQLADWLAARLDHRERAPGEVRTGVHGTDADGTDADGTDADGTDADETREVGMFERLTGRRRPRAGGLFQRFTPRARQAVEIAQQEARLLNHNYIGTEHILLGLIHEGEGVAAKALESLGISLEAVRAQVEEIIGQGQTAPTGHIPFTPRAKKVLELSLREALQLGHNYIGTEHILLGLIREGEGVAAQVLVKLGADLPVVRDAVLGGLGAPAVERQDLLADVNALFDENERLRTEIRRLRRALDRHGIDPDDKPASA